MFTAPALSVIAALLANLPMPLAALQADDKVQLKGKTTWTAISGDTGNEDVVLGRSANFHASYAITWWEDSDDPCKFELVTKHMNRGGEDGPDAEWCSGSPGNSKSVFRGGPNEYITAIQVCRTDKNDETLNKIKGLKVWGRTIDKRTGSLGSETGPDADDHNHCKVWENKVKCPDGQVASRIKVHYQRYWNSYIDGWSSHGYAKGISLGCRKVVPIEQPDDGPIVNPNAVDNPIDPTTQNYF
jgi:hypothetical protein